MVRSTRLSVYMAKSPALSSDTRLFWLGGDDGELLADDSSDEARDWQGELINGDVVFVEIDGLKQQNWQIHGWNYVWTSFYLEMWQVFDKATCQF